jgi:poly(A) polymerase
LRYFRFLARYGGGQIDGDAIRACAVGAHGLTALSRERIAQELTRILGLKNPVASVELMIDNGIFTPFLPELASNAADRLRHLVAREAQFAQPASLPARFLALLTRDSVAADKVAARLKLPNKMREGFAQRLRAGVPTPFNVRAIAYRTNIDAARDAVMLYAVDAAVPECLARLEQWDIPTLSIKGGELIVMGLPAGRLVAKTLQAIEAAWIDEGFPDIQRQNELASQTVHAVLSETKNA